MLRTAPWSLSITLQEETIFMRGHYIWFRSRVNPLGCWKPLVTTMSKALPWGCPGPRLIGQALWLQWLASPSGDPEPSGSPKWFLHAELHFLNAYEQDTHKHIHTSLHMHIHTILYICTYRQAYAHICISEHIQAQTYKSTHMLI